VLIHTSCKTSSEAFKVQCSMPMRGMATAPLFILGKPRIKIDRLWGLLGMISLIELASPTSTIRYHIAYDGPSRS
jgi:hypothetical protein